VATELRDGRDPIIMRETPLAQRTATVAPSAGARRSRESSARENMEA
jgi:hypothetical protein